MEIDLWLLLFGLLTLMTGLILKDLVKLFGSNTHKLDPKYMNDENTVKGTKLEIDEHGYVIITPTKRFTLNWYV